MSIAKRFAEISAKVLGYNENKLKRHLNVKSLAGVDLSGEDLRDAHLYQASMSGVNLSKANLLRADLYEADLSGANLSGANLRWANLNGANLSGANMTGADLRFAELLLVHKEAQDNILDMLAVAIVDETTRLPPGISLEDVQRAHAAVESELRVNGLRY